MRTVTKIADELTKKDFCRILAAPSWSYDVTPSQIYNLWEDYKANVQKTYTWDSMQYHEQVEATKKMYEWIHRLYCRNIGRNVVQTEICW